MTAYLQRFSYLLKMVPEGDVPALTLGDITKWRLLELAKENVVRVTLA